MTFTTIIYVLFTWDSLVNFAPSWGDERVWRQRWLAEELGAAVEMQGWGSERGAARWRVERGEARLREGEKGNRGWGRGVGARKWRGEGGGGAAEPRAERRRESRRRVWGRERLRRLRLWKKYKTLIRPLFLSVDLFLPFVYVRWSFFLGGDPSFDFFLLFFFIFLY